MAACSIRSTRRSSSLDAVQSAARLIGNDITGGSSGVRFWAPEAAGLPEDPKWRHRRRVPSISATTSAHLRAVVDGSGREVCIRCGPAASVQGVDSTLSFRRFNLLPQGNQHASGKRPSANVSFWAETRNLEGQWLISRDCCSATVCGRTRTVAKSVFAGCQPLLKQVGSASFASASALSKCATGARSSPAVALVSPLVLFHSAQFCNHSTRHSLFATAFDEPIHLFIRSTPSGSQRLHVSNPNKF
jgi:hypothetical protein